MSATHPALEKSSIRHSDFRNRVAVAPMTRISTRGDGVPTLQMLDYYRRYAQGGFGLIITEGVYTDNVYSQAYPNQPGIVNIEQEAAWRDIAEAVHDAGGKIVMQLMHAGALSQHLDVTYGPSAIQPLRKMLPGYSEKQGRFPLPEALTQADIERVIDGYVDSAKRAEQAGFDGVEIHSANGYLLDQFITEYTNQRDDNYGGSLENRCRLTIEIIETIKRHVSSKFIVGVRLSQGKVNDFDYLWPGGLDDGKVVFPLMEKAGADYIHFASEGNGYDHGCLTREGKSLPKQAKSITTLPVIANGGLHEPVEAARILNDNHADFIALGTGALANPDWPKRMETGLTIRPFDSSMLAEGVTVDAQLAWEKQTQRTREAS